MASGITKGGLIINGIFTAVDAGNRIAQGEGVVPSVVKAGLSGLAWDTVNGIVGGPAMLAVMGTQIGGMVLEGSIEAGRYNSKKVGKTLNNMLGGGQYADSENAQKMRNTAYDRMNAMNQNTQNTLGSEARMYFKRNVY